MEKVVKPRLQGEMKLYRFCDDFIVTFEHEEDAKRVLYAIRKRFEKFGLNLHPDKTRLIEFGRSAWVKGKRASRKPATFNFLGFTHYSGNTRRGKFTVKIKTMSKRMRRGLKRVGEWCKENRHFTLERQHQQLRSIYR